MNRPNKAFHHYGAQGAPRVNADVGEKTMKPANRAFRLVQAIALVLLLAALPGCTSLGAPVKLSQADIDYFRADAIRMVTDGFMIERDNGRTLIPVDRGEYDTNMPVTYRVRSGGHPRFFVTIPMVTRTGGHAQELEYDMATRQLVDVRHSLWEY